MNWNIKKNELKLEEEIGRGSFGVVRRAKWRHTQVAVKVLYDDALNEDRELFEREVKIMATLHHPNIVQFLGFSRTPELTLVIELFPEGSIEQFVPQEKPNHKTCIRLYTDMVLAIEYLHSRRPCFVIHRDIKPANFLLTASRRVKLGDFGIARTPKTIATLGKPLTDSVSALDLNARNTSTESLAQMSPEDQHHHQQKAVQEDPRCISLAPNEEMLTSNCGTARYMAPEVASVDGTLKPYTPAADVFSMAMVFYFVLERKPPSIPAHNIPSKHLEALHAGRRPTFNRTPKPVRELIDSMWHIDAATRPTASEILDYLASLKCSTSVMGGDGKVFFSS